MPRDVDKHFKIQRLVELDQQNKSLREISEELRITPPTIYVYRETPEYLELKEKALKQSEKTVLSRIRESTEQTRAKLSNAVPRAIETLIEIMTNSNSEKMKKECACEILDRDGRFVKVSRLMNVQAGDEKPLLPEDAAAEIIAALKKVKPSSTSVQ
jgi:hypothetical protein